MKFVLLAVCVVAVHGARLSVLKPAVEKLQEIGQLNPAEIAKVQVSMLDKITGFLEDLRNTIFAKTKPEPAHPVAIHEERKVDAPAAKATDDGLKICTWNAFRFGTKKFDADVEKAWSAKYKLKKIDMLADQIKQCDILALQEFFDETEETLKTLVARLNEKTGEKYAFKCGPRVGRVSKEQYCFIYKSDIISIGKSGTAPETKDIFSREPFYAQFKADKKSSSLKSFVLGTIHTEPAHAAEEIDALVEAMAWAEKEFGTPDVMTLGDYNADCQYMTKASWATVRLKTDPAYQWFIPDGTDTASMKSECTFDRAVTKSQKIKAAFVAGSTKVLDFVKQYGIQVEEARQLSDHFPVMMTFK